MGRRETNHPNTVQSEQTENTPSRPPTVPPKPRIQNLPAITVRNAENIFKKVIEI